VTTPPISVLIPAYNESDHIADVVAGIPSEVEHVAVVDDGSTDNTAEVVRQADDPRIFHYPAPPKKTLSLPAFRAEIH